MNGIFWVLMVGITGWLTGLLIGQKGYARTSVGCATNGLDIVLGIIGASIGGYLFLWLVVGQGGSFNRYAIAVLGSASLVALVRLGSATCSPAKSR